jgi:predicted DNA-binding transcriptional regulator AlpA
MDNGQINDAVLDPEAASEYLGWRISVQTLARYRCEGKGPRFIKLGSRVGYRRSALDEWMKTRERTSTSATRPPLQPAA